MSLYSQQDQLSSKSLEKDVEKGSTIPIAEVIAVEDFDDPNIDPDGAIAGILEDDSPYPEVRSAVANTDDPDIPVSTLRAWVIGLIWTILVPGLNQFFFFRYPSVTIGGIVAQLLSFPVGRAWARFIPNKKIFGIAINPGPFSIKEHVLITIMASVGTGSAYATDIVAVQRVFYNQIYPFSYQWMIVMSTQLLGFSVGGIARRFLVQPPSMIWPANLVTCALFNTLHSTDYAGVGNRGGMSRERFFFYCFLASSCWYFLPGYLFQALSYFSWVCWIAPDDVVVNELFGYQHGLGMSLITFDWAQIAYIGSPLATPWWAEANIAAGFVFFFWFLTPLLHYTNQWNSKYFPISSRGSFTNTGAKYDVRRIINPDSSFNQEAYSAYSPLYLSTTFAITYGLSFASITATLMHAFLYFRKQIWAQSRRAMSEQPDIHARLMSGYAQVPEWWYACIFLSTFGIGVAALQIWPIGLPVQWFVLALVIAFFYIIPIGMIQAITNQQVGLSVITELIVGYGLPGRPIAMMMFKTWGYITMAQALMYFFLVGAICPALVYITTKKFPNSFIRYVNFPVIFSGTSFIPPASAMNYVPWAITGFIFQYVIRRRHFSWWTKYNYVLSAALDAGVAIAAVLIFFILQYPNNGDIGSTTIQKWWGNTVFANNADAEGRPMRTIAKGEFFGPRTWT